MFLLFNELEVQLHVVIGLENSTSSSLGLNLKVNPTYACTDLDTKLHYSRHIEAWSSSCVGQPHEGQSAVGLLSAANLHWVWNADRTYMCCFCSVWDVGDRQQHWLFRANQTRYKLFKKSGAGDGRMGVLCVEADGLALCDNGHFMLIRARFIHIVVWSSNNTLICKWKHEKKNPGVMQE